MKDADDWDFILNTVDALFYGLSNGIASRTSLSLVDSHEGLWASFAQGCFKLRGGDDESIGVVPCQRRGSPRRGGAEQTASRLSAAFIEQAIAAA